MQFGINKHEQISQRLQKKLHEPVGRVQLVVFEKFASAYLFQIAREKSFDYLTNKEASTVFCSVVKHAGSGRARKKCRGKHETQSSVFPHFLSALPLPKCFTTEQNTVEASLFVL